MKKTVLLTCLAALAVTATAYEVSYTYDAAGNRILREPKTEVINRAVRSLPDKDIYRLSSAAFTSHWDGVDHNHRWFETNASRLGANYFDKKYGSGKSGYQKGSKDFFDMDSFIGQGTSGAYKSPYENPRTGSNWQDKAFLISSPHISWWDFLPF